MDLYDSFKSVMLLRRIILGSFAHSKQSNFKTPSLPSFISATDSGTSGVPKDLKHKHSPTKFLKTNDNSCRVGKYNDNKF